MTLDPKRKLKKKREAPKVKVDEEVIVEEVKTPITNQNKMEAMNLEKLKKSLRELISEKEGGSIKKLKTFALN